MRKRGQMVVIPKIKGKEFQLELFGTKRELNKAVGVQVHGKLMRGRALTMRVYPNLIKGRTFSARLWSGL